jgi:membrane protein required for colicin V production
MGLVDIILGLVLVFGLYKGLKNGLFIELASLLSLFVGVFVAIKFSYLAVGFFPATWSTKTIKIMAFVVVMILIVIALHQLAKLLSGLANAAYLGWLNKVGGAVFATIKTILLLGLLLHFIQKINYNDLLISKKTQSESIFFNPILKTTDTVLPLLTDWFIDLKKSTTLSN